MADKRNIVIKVNYPLAGKATRHLAPKMITEWNVKRITFAVVTVVMVLATLIYVFMPDSTKVDVDHVAVKEAAVISESAIIKSDVSEQRPGQTDPVLNLKKEPPKKNQATAIAETLKKHATEAKEHKPLHQVSRSALTYGINHKEPTGEIVRTLKLNGKKPVWIYYFTELKAMKGNRVYHQWFKNGLLVSKQSIVIAADIWRTSSRKLLSEKDKGQWTVKIVDDKNRLLNEKTFNIE